MKKLFFFAATAAIALSSCSSDDLAQAPVTGPEVNDGAVTFDVYSARQTRAYTFDKTNVGNDALKVEGFGVFAYDQGAGKQTLNSYLATNTYPNFMYNQRVKGYTTGAVALADDGSDVASFDHWSYEPIKYWPNHGGYVTFQAYAPYDEDITPIFNDLYKGVGIRYNNSNPKDLLWGANGTASTAECFHDQPKPTVTDVTKFYFKHALAKLDFTVSYFSDKVHGSADTGLADGQEPLDANTKIVIRSIYLEGVLPTQGVLSLYNGNWYIEKTESNIGYDANDLTHTYNTGTSKWEKISAPGEAAGTLTKNTKSVAPEKSMMVIPSTTTGSFYDVVVVYDVITTSAADDRNNTTTTHTIKATEIGTYVHPDAHNEAPFKGITVDAGKHTTINIHIGMTSAKFEALVVDWDETESTDIDMTNNKLEEIIATQSTAAPEYIDPANWLGTTTLVPAVTAADMFYYDGTKLYKSIDDSGIKWAAAPNGDYVYNSQLYTVAGGAGAATVKDAAKWWLDDSDNYWLLVNGKYYDKGAIADTYADVDALLEAVKAGTAATDKVYKVGTQFYYVK